MDACPPRRLGCPGNVAAMGQAHRPGACLLHCLRARAPARARHSSKTARPARSSSAGAAAAARDTAEPHGPLAAAAALLFLAAPQPALAEQALTPVESVSAGVASSLLAASVKPPRLPAEAPALVGNGGEALLEGVKGMVESGLQDLAASSMAPVGGPVTGELDVQPAVSSAVASPTPQQQQQGRLHVLWCGAWQRYCESLESSPLLTKVYTSVVGTLLGDLTAQLLSHLQQQQQQQRRPGRNSSGFRYDPLRSARLCLYSAFLGTPMAHYWYQLLDQAVTPGTPLAPATVAAKVCLDQLVQTPFGMALFLTTMKLLEGRPGEVQQELRSKMRPALVANWRVWFPAQALNFSLVPEDQRILFCNTVGILWTIIISNMQQAQQQPEPSTVSSLSGLRRVSSSSAV